MEDERRERILAEHPEYREAIERGEERVGEVSPRTHLAMHEVIAEQLAANDPPEARAAYLRLLELGHDEHADCRRPSGGSIACGRGHPYRIYFRDGR